jgi:aryl-alcohol dehydrogenase-like predicted oxidoreductase
MRSSATRTRTASSTSRRSQRRSLEARKAGKLRYIGFTGHKDPRVHLYTLEVARDHGFTFNTVQMPVNVMDAHYRSFEKLVLPELVKQNSRRLTQVRDRL